MSLICMNTRQRFSIINQPLALSAWCIFSLAFCLSTSTSSAQTTEFLTDSYGLQIPSENRYGFAEDFLAEETNPRVSAAKKIDLIRYYLGAKIPNERVAVVMDTAENYFENIKSLWKLVVTRGQISQDVMLFVYNDTDCSFLPPLRYGNRTITEVLNGISASAPMSNGAGSILECVNLAVKMIDSNSSVMLFTGRKTKEGITLGESTANEMIRKRKEFNCIWCANEPGNPEEVNDYEEIARHTNGHFLQFTRADHDEMIGWGSDPHQGYKPPGNETKSNDFSLDIERSLPRMEISRDETADLLYDPKISDHPAEEARALSSIENSARIVTAGEEKAVRKESLELEDMELASLTAIESAIRLETTSIEVTAASSLVGTPGSVSRLTFTVTNNYPVTIRHYFQGRSTSFSLVYLEPRNAWIESGQSVNVVADVLVPTTATSSTIGTVTLVVQSIGSVEKSAYIYVRATGSTIYDTVKPTINYSFNSNCAGKLGSGTCSNNLWSVDVTVQDSDSGLQRVTSSPKGILAATTFVSGIKSATKFQYAATCCLTTVVITAEDLLGNSNSETIDVTVWYNLSQGEIIAVIIGTFFLFLIIVIIILIIILCIRRRRKSQELPFTQRYGSRPPVARAERTSF